MERMVLADDIQSWRKILHGMELAYELAHGEQCAVVAEHKHPGMPSIVQTRPILPSFSPPANENEGMRLLFTLNTIESVLNKILYIKAEYPFCKIVFDSPQLEPLYLQIGVQDLVHYFSEAQLMRVHRSHLINPKKVLCLEKRQRDFVIWMKDRRHATESLPVGRSFVTELRQKCGDWFR